MSTQARESHPRRGVTAVQKEPSRSPVQGEVRGYVGAWARVGVSACGRGRVWACVLVRVCAGGCVSACVRRYVCACVRVCVCACERGRVCAWVRACVRGYVAHRGRERALRPVRRPHPEQRPSGCGWAGAHARVRVCARTHVCACRRYAESATRTLRCLDQQPPPHPPMVRWHVRAAFARANAMA